VEEYLESIQKEIDELISIELNMKNRVRKKKKTKLLGVKTFKMLSRRYHSKIVHLLSNLFYFFAENIYINNRFRLIPLILT